MKNTVPMRAVLVILALSLLVCFAGCEKKNERAKQDVIEELVVDHASYGAEAKERVGTLLAELDGMDADAAKRWTKIVGIWEECEAGTALNYDVLPDGLPDTDELCLVVLGFQLNEDGTMKEELIERLTVAKNCAEKYPNALIVCTGGGTAKNNENATEAGEMAKWLIAEGIEKERVIVEDKSITTAQNAIYTYDIIEKDYPQVNKLAIVSSDYHIATGRLLFEAEAILRAKDADAPGQKVVSNAAWKAPKGELSAMFQAGALIELSGDKETAFEIYYDNYDIHELPPIK